MDNIEQKLKKSMSQIFGIPVNKISEDASPDTIEEWDSLRHMNLILALEEAFNVKFLDEDIVELLSYKLLLGELKKLVKKPH